MMPSSKAQYSYPALIWNAISDYAPVLNSFASDI